MAGEDPLEPRPGEEQADDVVGKIDQLLNRHRPRSAPVEDLPILTEEQAPPPQGDGIPILTDVVDGKHRPPEPSVPSPPRAAVATPGTMVNSTLILRRLALALEAEHARLRAQTGGDALQVRLLDRLVAELRRALPGAIRGALAERPAPEREAQSTKEAEDRRL